MAERSHSAPGSLRTTLADARLVAAKDLRLELRSRVGIGQVVPFALLVVLLFAFALDPDRRVLGAATPGLFWMVVLFSAVLAVGRSFGTEAEDGVLDALRLSGLSPAGIYFGKVVPRIGALLSDGDAYRYLPRSVEYLPTPDELLALVGAAGFTHVHRTLLSGGIAQLITATRG